MKQQRTSGLLVTVLAFSAIAANDDVVAIDMAEPRRRL